MWVDLHHVQEAQDGGPTDLNNLVSLCKPHHALLHTNGWTITENPNKPGRYIITTPTGTQLNTQHNGKPSP
jgi:predicted restriction endonuclease